MLTLSERKRLTEIRAKLLKFSSRVDTSTWEATFFLDLLAKKDRQIREMKHMSNPRRSASLICK
jgi:hypothetical protein